MAELWGSLQLLWSPRFFGIGKAVGHHRKKGRKDHQRFKQ